MQMFILVSISVLAGAELDIFVPSFALIKQQFNIGSCATELMISVNMMFQCILGVISGYLGDKFGRKPVITISLMVFTLGSILCTFAEQYSLLLCGRALQGMGISAPLILIFSVLTSNFPIVKQHRLIGILTGSGSLAVAFAPVIGGYIIHYFNWHATFVVLSICGLIMTFLSTLIQDKAPDNRQLKLSLGTYLPVISSKKTMLYIAMIALMVQPYYIFTSIAPILYVEDLGMSVTAFSVLQGLLAFCFAFVSISSAYITKLLGKQLFFRISLLLIGLSIIMIAVALLANINHPYYITGAMAIVSIGVVLPLNETVLLAMNSVPGQQNNASAMISTIRLVVTSLSVQMAGYWHNGSFFTTGLMSFIFLTTSLALLWFLQVRDKNFNRNFHLKN